jgi:hypothetical protein
MIMLLMIMMMMMMMILFRHFSHIVNELIIYSLPVALQFYGVEKVSLSGNGLFALGMIAIIILIITIILQYLTISLSLYLL